MPNLLEVGRVWRGEAKSVYAQVKFRDQFTSQTKPGDGCVLGEVDTNERVALFKRGLSR